MKTRTILDRMKERDPLLYFTVMQRAVAQAIARKQTFDIQWCPHTPFAKQKQALDWEPESESEKAGELFYGGAAAGGKSDLLLMKALKYVHVPGYAALILRRTYSDLTLPGAIMDRFEEWMDDKPIKWDRDSHTCIFPSGAKISFGYLRNAADVKRYKSAEFQNISIDELTETIDEEDTYTYLFSRIRRSQRLKEMGVPLLMCSASNPGGPGHEWVKRRLVDAPNSKTKMFIQAKATDNTEFDADAYYDTLELLDDIAKAQLKDGDWSVHDPKYLAMQLIMGCKMANVLWKDGARFRPTYPHYIGFDVGRSRDYSVITVGEQDGDIVYIREIHELDDVPFAQQEAILDGIFRRVNVIGCRIDKGGIGLNLSEKFETRYAGIVEGVSLGEAMQAKMATQLQNALAFRELRIPDDPKYWSYLRQVNKGKKIQGLPKAVTLQSNDGHGDHFWSLALMREAVGYFIPTPNVLPTVLRGRS